MQTSFTITTTSLVLLPESLYDTARRLLPDRRTAAQLHQQDAHDVEEEQQVEKCRDADRIDQHDHVIALVDPASERAHTGASRV